MVAYQMNLAFDAFQAGVERTDPREFSCTGIRESSPGFRTDVRDGELPKTLRPHQREGVGLMLDILDNRYLDAA